MTLPVNDNHHAASIAALDVRINALLLHPGFRVAPHWGGDQDDFMIELFFLEQHLKRRDVSAEARAHARRRIEDELRHPMLPANE